MENNTKVLVYSSNYIDTIKNVISGVILVPETIRFVINNIEYYVNYTLRLVLDDNDGLKVYIYNIDSYAVYNENGNIVSRDNKFLEKIENNIENIVFDTMRKHVSGSPIKCEHSPKIMHTNNELCCSF